MPLYDFECKECGSVAEVRASMSEKENLIVRCEKCGSEKMEQVFQSIAVIGAGAGEHRHAPKSEAPRGCRGNGSGCACSHG